jgi:predicted dehydrogenase
MKKVRYGVIGIKGVGKFHCRSAQQNEKVDLAALVDVDAEFVKKRSEELNVRGFTDCREMLDAGIVDAVSIATPHNLHAPIALACLNAGVHVFIEKPFANRVSEADEMIKVAKAKSLKICVGHQYRTYRSARAMKHLIDTGSIGRMLRVLWTWGEFRPESYYTRDIWRATWRHAGGGVLMNQASHDLDLLCWMIGEPVQVSALVANQLHKAETEDTVCANILFANGALGSIQLTINQPKGYSTRQVAGEKGIIVIQDVQSLNSDENDQILLGTYENGLPKMLTELTGFLDQPRITWQPITFSRQPARRPMFRKLKAVGHRLGLMKRAQADRPHGISALMDSFAEAIINEGEPIVNGASALQAVELINAIVLAAIRKRTVDLPVDRDEYDQLFEELSNGKTQVPRLRQYL